MIIHYILSEGYSFLAFLYVVLIWFLLCNLVTLFIGFETFMVISGISLKLFEVFLQIFCSSIDYIGLLPGKQ